jgi:hypothetical protein
VKKSAVVDNLKAQKVCFLNTVIRKALACLGVTHRISTGSSECVFILPM